MTARHSLLLAILLSSGGCALVSRDPGQGGLLGYLAHGKQYPQYIAQLQQAAQTEQAEAQRQAALTPQLQAEVTTRREQLESLLNTYWDLKMQLDALEQKTATASPEALLQIQPQIADQRARLATASADAQLPLAQRARLLAELKQDVANLTERAQLLLQVQ